MGRNGCYTFLMGNTTEQDTYTFACTIQDLMDALNDPSQVVGMSYVNQFFTTKIMDEVQPS